MKEHPGKHGLPTALLVALLGLTWGLGGCLADGEGGEGPPAETAPEAPPGWPRIAWPADNPYSAAKAELGRKLFFDPRLSSDEAISCSWCHDPRAAFADQHGTALSTGVRQQLTRRNPPTLTNVAFGTTFTLAGGIPTLEQQALAPLFAPDEMDMTGPEIEAVVRADTAYVRLFEAAFGPEPPGLAMVTKALATYQRTLISASSPYDRWAAGDTAALSPAARRGAALFLGEKGDCWHCHAPPLFTDGKFHNIGLDSLPEDLGRALVTGRRADEGKFKTPTLRNVPATAPYMHDGRFETLEDVIEHYNSGGVEHPNRDPLMRPLGLTRDERDDLAAFLQSLLDREFLERHTP